jgi:hypothetical protein
MHARSQRSVSDKRTDVGGVAGSTSGAVMTRRANIAGTERIAPTDGVDRAGAIVHNVRR